MATQEPYFTLKQVLQSIKKTLSERYVRTYWVKAEMHKLNQFPSGHCFPELLQKEDGKVVAQIGGKIWKAQFEVINKRFIEVAREPLKEDTTLLMLVKITFDEVYGLSLQILDIDPSFTLGELQKERAETLKKLKAENLINVNQLLPFPLLPKRIAVISAESSKGLSDFNQVLDQNAWGYTFFRMLFPAYLQGDVASASIIAALKKIESVKAHFDVVVIVRGGGGEVGLSCYNDYDLCRAIATFPLPVLTGIGHSTNMTVAEMIAFRNAITPTELGEFFIQSFHNFSVPLKDAVKTLKQQTRNLLRVHTHDLTMVSTNFQFIAQGRVKAEQQFLSNAGVGIRSGIRFHFLTQREVLNALRQNASHAGVRILERERESITRTTEKLGGSALLLLKHKANATAHMEQSVRLMDPVNVLNRGYSITMLNNKVLSESNRARTGDTIITRNATFEIKSTVIELKENHE